MSACSTTPPPYTIDTTRDAWATRIALIIERVTAPRIAPDMPLERTLHVSLRLVEALIAHALSSNTSLPPFLDHCWHDLILETRLYAEFCGPDFLDLPHLLAHSSLTSLDALSLKNKRVDALRTCCRNLFGDESVSDAQCWETERAPVKRKLEELEREDSFCVFIKALLDPDTAKHTLWVYPRATVSECMQAFRDQQMVQTGAWVEAVGTYRWIVAGTQLKEDALMSSLKANETIHHVERLRGC